MRSIGFPVLCPVAALAAGATARRPTRCTPRSARRRAGMAEHWIVNLQSSTAKVIRLDTKGHPGDLRGKHFAGMAHM
jgi:hypothetical protein